MISTAVSNLQWEITATFATELLFQADSRILKQRRSWFLGAGSHKILNINRNG